MSTPMPPKQITLNAPTYRYRTAVWLKKAVATEIEQHMKQEQDNYKLWNRWDGIVTDMDAYEEWSKRGAFLTCLILTDLDDVVDTEQLLTRLYEIAGRLIIMVLPQSLISQKTEEYWIENFDNVLALEQLAELYPFLGPAWNGTIEDAVQMCALLCRYHRLVIPHGTSLSATVPIRSTSLVVEIGKIPEPIWLITQYYTSPSKERQAEINTCLSKNEALPWIDRIVLLNEREEPPRKSGKNPKTHTSVIGHRLTYQDVLEYVRSDAVPPGVIIVLCNSDIYFDVELTEVWRIDLRDRLLALLRWDVPPNGITEKAELFGPRADSQDTWIFLSDSVKARPPPSAAEFGFPLGRAGCDNAFAAAMMRSRYVITNPALTLKTYHLHNSNVRTYRPTDVVPSSLYVNLAPTYLVDTKQEIVPKGAPSICLCNESVTFEVKSSSLSNEITYCTMLEKEGRYKWEPQVENYAFEPAIPVYSVAGAAAAAGAAVTSNGLIYEPQCIYIGRHALLEGDRFNYWKDVTIDWFTRMHHVTSKMIAIPFSVAVADEVFHHEDRYLLEYLGRVIRLLGTDVGRGAAFWVPHWMRDTVRQMLPGIREEQMVNYDANMVCWAEGGAIGYLPSPATTELSREDIVGLRAAHAVRMGYTPSSTAKHCTVLCPVEGSPLTEAFVHDQLRPLFANYGWTVTVNQPDTAALCILIGEKGQEATAAHVWRLPIGAHVLDFQQELKLDGQCEHWCHMAGIESWVLFLSKGTMVDVQDQLTVGVKKWMNKHHKENDI